MFVELESVEYSYPGGVRALDGVSLTVAPAERVAIIGQNGAGKTTVVKLMNALLRPTTGRVLLDGADTARMSTAAVARQVAYVFQNPDDQLFGKDVRSEVAFVPRMLKLDDDEVGRRVGRALELTGLSGTESENPQDFPLVLRKFVAIASVLASDARLVILDEPTAGLDLVGRLRLSAILDDLSAAGVATLTISHDMRFVADHFSRVVVMANGRVVADATREEVFASDDTLAEAKLQRPPAAQLASELRLPGSPLDVEAIADSIARRQLT